MRVYDEGAEPIDENALIGEPCWIGVDLSSIEDLTAVVAAFRAPSGGYILVPRFFVPEATLRKRQERDKLPYIEWAERGFLTATPGEVVDYDIVVEAILDMAGRYRVTEVAIDRWNSTAVTTKLTAAGLTVVQFGQGFASMAGPIRELERAILSRCLQHSGHPVLRWNFGNVAVESDAAGNKKFTKAGAAEMIDGAVAAVMAVGRAFVADTLPSVYESRGIVVF
jgi:phage terminase large subunit-like protein